MLSVDNSCSPKIGRTVCNVPLQQGNVSPTIRSHLFFFLMAKHLQMTQIIRTQWWRVHLLVLGLRANNAFFSQLWFQWCLLDSMITTKFGIFTPWKLANAINCSGHFPMESSTPLSRGPVGLIFSISILIATVHPTVLSMPGGEYNAHGYPKDSKHKKIPWGLPFGLKKSIQDRKIHKMKMVLKLMLLFKAMISRNCSLPGTCWEKELYRTVSSQLSRMKSFFSLTLNSL